MHKLTDFNDHVQGGGQIPDLVEVSDPIGPPREIQPQDDDDDLEPFELDGNDGEMPVIVWRPGHISEVVDLVERILVANGVRCYAFGDTVAVVVWNRSSGKPARIVVLDHDRMIAVLAATIRWFQVRSLKNGGEREVECNPPAIIARQLLVHDHRRLPCLTTIVQLPALLPSGRLVSAPGFDEESGVFAAFNADRFAALKPTPTQGDAAEALRQFLDVFCDFYFDHEAGPFAAVAAVLTLVCRSAISGAVPLMLVTASTPGTGKSLLVSIVTAIGIGKEAPRMAQVDDTEMEKRITAALITGAGAIVIDNAKDTIGCPALDALLTASGEWHGRILGETRDAVVAVRAVIFATGNNLKLAGDLQRRVLPITLVAKQERPEERQDFKVKDLLAHVLENRDRLAMAAITILHAYMLAPDQVEPPTLGSYGNWSRLVRGAVIWAGGLDPVATREALLAESDDVKLAWGELLALLDANFRTNTFTAAEAAEFLAGHTAIRDTLLGEKAADGKSLGRLFAKWKGRIVGNLMLSVTPLTTGGLKHWKVINCSAGGTEPGPG